MFREHPYAVVVFRTASAFLQWQPAWSRVQNSHAEPLVGRRHPRQRLSFVVQQQRLKEHVYGLFSARLSASSGQLSRLAHEPSGSCFLQMEARDEDTTQKRSWRPSRDCNQRHRSGPSRPTRSRLPRHPSKTLAPDQARLFVAFEIPPAFLEAAAKAQRFLQEQWPAVGSSAANEARLPAQPPVRWTSPDSWHITLHFMGTTPRERIPQVIERLADLSKQHSKVTLATKTIAGLPPATNRRRLRVICLEINEVAFNDRVLTLPALVDTLAEQLASFPVATSEVEDELRPNTRAPRKRPQASAKPYMPHLTLGRVKDWASYASLEQLWSLIQLASTGVWLEGPFPSACFSHITLYESLWEQHDSAPIYKPLGHFKLQEEETIIGPSRG
jgi:2'-5' RNA ligase